VSNTARHFKRRRGLSHWTPAKPGEDIQVATTYAGAPDAAALPEARLVSHDQLIRMLGDRRRSGVQWMELPPDKAIEFLSEDKDVEHFGRDADTAMSDLISYLEAHPDGFLVVAMADAVR
jgi:hypothetical protein